MASLPSSYTRSNSWSQSLNVWACVTLAGSRPKLARWDSWAGEIRVEGRLVGPPLIIISKIASRSVNILKSLLIRLFLKMNQRVYEIYNFNYFVHFGNRLEQWSHEHLRVGVVVVLVVEHLLNYQALVSEKSTGATSWKWMDLPDSPVGRRGRRLGCPWFQVTYSFQNDSPQYDDRVQHLTAIAMSSC